MSNDTLFFDFLEIISIKVDIITFLLDKYSKIKNQ